MHVQFAQDTFLEDSKHEILMEKDPIRDAAMKATLNFFGN